MTSPDARPTVNMTHVSVSIRPHLHSRRPPPLNGTQNAESNAHFPSSHFAPLPPSSILSPSAPPPPVRLMVLKMRARHMRRRDGRVRGLSRAGAWPEGSAAVQAAQDDARPPRARRALLYTSPLLFQAHALENFFGTPGDNSRAV